VGYKVNVKVTAILSWYVATNGFTWFTPFPVRKNVMYRPYHNVNCWYEWKQEMV